MNDERDKNIKRTKLMQKKTNHKVH